MTMTFDTTVTIITLVAAAAGFVWGRIRADVVALLALLTLMITDVITTGEALSGFANPIVIMMVGLFVVGGAIFNTGLAKIIGARLLKLAGTSQTRLFLLVMGGTALIGGFVSNTGTVALMLPIVASMAAGAGISASRLLMPLAFASSLGGMMTLIGTPPNLIIAEAWEDLGNHPLSFFTFLPAGAVCLVAGTLLLIPLSKWFLKGHAAADSSTSDRPKTLAELVEEYGLNANLHRLTVPDGSPVAGKTIGNLNLRRHYDIDVIEVRSAGRAPHLIRHISQTAPMADTDINPGDTLYVRGATANVNRCAAALGLAVDDSAPGQLEFYDIGIAEIIIVPDSSVTNSSIAAIGFRDRYGVNVIGVRRRGQIITDNLPDLRIHQGDVLLVQGSWQQVAQLNATPHAWVVLGQPLAEAAKVTLDYKAPLAAVIMLGMVVALVMDVAPAVVCVMVAAMLTVLLGCFRNVDDAYHTINWSSIVLIAAMMPMSFALEKTGLSAIVSTSLASYLGALGPVWLLVGIYFTTSVMTLFISNTATAVLLAPIAVESAMALGASPLPFLFAVTFGASLCFASPFSTPPNALVMPAGQYTFADYIKVGLPLQLLLGMLMVAVLPLIFPF